MEKKQVTALFDLLFCFTAPIVGSNWKQKKKGQFYQSLFIKFYSCSLGLVALILLLRAFITFLRRAALKKEKAQRKHCINGSATAELYKLTPCLNECGRGG